MKKVIFILIVSSVFFVGCSNYNTMAPSHPYMLLDKSQYVIIGDIEGEAEQVQYIFGFINSRLSKSSTISKNDNDYNDGRSRNSQYSFNLNASLAPGINIRFPIVIGSPEYMAVYDAISKNDGTDFMIYPRFEYEVSGFPPLYKKIKIRVKGKGVRLLTENNE